MITWDYPDTINGPADVHLRLFEAGNPNPLVHIGDARASEKSFLWNVPDKAPYLEKNGLYVSVSGAGTPAIGPGFGNRMGANSGPFNLAAAAGTADAGAFGQAGAGVPQEDNNEFKQQQVEDIETDTVTVTTNTVTIKTTITESNAAAGMASSGSSSHAFWFLVLPLLVLLF